jgi:prevent-host-death family protein
MASIGIRSLQQNAAAVLRKVRRGEPVEVTDRGHPVARLVPATAGRNVVDLLESSGSLRRAEDDLLALGEPLAISRGKESASARLAKMRRRER